MVSYEQNPLAVYAREIMAAILESGAVTLQPVRALSEEVGEAYPKLLDAISRGADKQNLEHVETAKNLVLAMIRGKLIPRNSLQLSLQVEEVGEAFGIVLGALTLQQ